MKIKSSLKSLKKRDLNSKLVRRRGRVYIINKTNPKFKARQKQFLWITKTIKVPGTILQVARMFEAKIKFLPSRQGERYASALTNMNLSNKVYKIFGKHDLRDYIENIVKKAQ